jgi:hypothetical protein
VRERTCRAVRTEERNAHRLGGALLDSLRALIAVESRGPFLDVGRLVVALGYYRTQFGFVIPGGTCRSSDAS